MLKILLAGTGGFAGSVCRYLTSLALSRLFPESTLAYGTLAANVLGCFFIGILGGWWETSKWLTPELRILLMVGFLGGFTTFSTFGWESLALGRAGHPGAAFLNIGLHLTLGFLGVWLGLVVSRIW